MNVSLCLLQEEEEAAKKNLVAAQNEKKTKTDELPPEMSKQER